MFFGMPYNFNYLPAPATLYPITTKNIIVWAYDIYSYVYLYVNEFIITFCLHST